MSAYAFAHGSPFSGDADEIQAELERIKRTGGLTPEAVVTAARPTGSVLHPLIFNVPAKKAAERYYLARAQSLIVAIRVVTEEGETTSLRANLRTVVGDDEAIYLGLDDEAARAQRVTFLSRRLRSIKDELRELDLYPAVQFAIEEALAA